MSIGFTMNSCFASSAPGILFRSQAVLLHLYFPKSAEGMQENALEMRKKGCPGGRITSNGVAGFYVAQAFMPGIHTTRTRFLADWRLAAAFGGREAPISTRDSNGLRIPGMNAWAK